jgi:hypothetical protein
MPADPNDPRYLPTLRSGLCNMAGAEERWAALAERGATDEELTAALRYELGVYFGSSGSGWLNVACSGQPPRVWIDDEHISVYGRKPDYQGASLLALARQLFGIGLPVPAGQLSLFDDRAGGTA